MARVGREPAIEHALDHRPVELHVGVAQERHEVVLPRRLQRVLEVDDHHVLGLHHQIPALVVAVGEARGLGVQAFGDALEDLVQPGALGGGRQLAGACLEPPLAEVVQLPVVELDVEGAREGEAARVGRLLCLGAQLRQQVDGALVEPLLARRLAQERRLEGEVAQILEHHQALALVVVHDLGHAHAQTLQVAVHVDEGELGRRRALGLLFAPGGVPGHHHDDEARALADAVVGAVRGVALELQDLRGPGVGAGRRGDEAPQALLEDGFAVAHLGCLASVRRERAKHSIAERKRRLW